MKKAHVKTIVIYDKIYIKKEDVDDVELLVRLFSYPGVEEDLTTLEENATHYMVPSNGYYKLTWDNVVDNRTFEKLTYDLNFTGTLRPEQEESVAKFLTKGRAISGIFQAECGYGKTFAGCAIVARNNTRALILVHTKLLFRQWIDELEKLLDNTKIGKVGDGLFKLEDVTVAIYKTAFNNIDKLRDEFSLAIIDECHKSPANMFSTVVNNLSAKVKIGISATPKRKDGKHVFLYDFFSPFHIVAKDARTLLVPSVKIIDTDFKFNVIQPKRDWARQINKIAANKNYIKLIANHAIADISNNRCILILSDRLSMLKELENLIPQSVLLVGATKNDVREDILKNAGSKYKAILTTRIFDEGISCHRLDTIYTTCPSNNPNLLEQRIGRIIREHPNKENPLIKDFWLRGHIVARQQASRQLWYRQRGYNIL